MKHSKRNIAHQAGRLFYSGHSWVRQDVSGIQRVAVEFGHVAHTHGPRQAKADD